MSKPPPGRPVQDDAAAAVEASPAAGSSISDDQAKADDPSWCGYFLFLGQRLFLYFTLYALSIGPFYWQWYKAQFVSGSSIVAAFYLPLVTIAEWIPPFGDWMDWYVNLWIA